MLVAFSAQQNLRLVVDHQNGRLADYLTQDERVVRALLRPSQLEVLAPARYRYNMSRLQVFQLEVRPVVDLRTTVVPQRLEIRSCDSRLEGLGSGYGFQLQLYSWLAAEVDHLVGEASLTVKVKRPPMLRLVPQSVLEATGRRILANIVGRLQARVVRQVVPDFRAWCRDRST